MTLRESARNLVAPNSLPRTTSLVAILWGGGGIFYDCDSSQVTIATGFWDNRIIQILLEGVLESFVTIHLLLLDMSGIYDE